MILRKNQLISPKNFFVPPGKSQIPSEEFPDFFREITDLFGSNCSSKRLEVSRSCYRSREFRKS